MLFEIRMLAALSAAMLLAGNFPCTAKSILSVPQETNWGNTNLDNDEQSHQAALLLKSDMMPNQSRPDNGQTLDQRTSPLSPASEEQSGQKTLPLQSSDSAGSEAKGQVAFVEQPDEWSRYYEGSQRDYISRRFDLAEAKLLAAIKIAKQGMSDDRQLLLSRILLAKVYLAKEQWDEAEKLYSLSMPGAKRIFGINSLETADCQFGLAKVYLLTGKFARAEEMIKQSITIRQKLLGPSHELAESLILQGTLQGKTNWIEQSEDTMRSGIKMFVEHPTSNSMDLADAYAQAARLFQSHGRTQVAGQLFDSSDKILNQLAKLNLPPGVAGEVRLCWEEGSPQSQEIPDVDFPLRYLSVNNVRVAATLVDLWELEGVLISITNVGDEQVSLGLGKPALFSRSADDFHVHLQPMELIDPNNIDRIRRERVMWDLTQNRPWLANMQKTRSQRGFVPPHGHDLFRGPNVFGVYGEWNALPRDLPQTFMLEPSPERVQYQAQAVIDPGLVRSSSIKVSNLVPLTLEPFESRTGELFYLNTRPERMLLTVPIGNVVYEIPFNARRKRIK